MKPLLFLALAFSLLGAAAFAEEIPQVSLDLDRDGKPDLVRIVDMPHDVRRLEVHLSRNNDIYVFDRLLPLPAKDDTCNFANMAGASLAVAPSKHAFVLENSTGDMDGWHGDRLDGCNRLYGQRIQIALEFGRLVVERVFTDHGSYHSGDTSPYESWEYDFTKKTARLQCDDLHNMHANTHPTNPFVDQRKPLSAFCGVSLSAYDREGLPACAKVLVRPKACDED